MACFQRGNEFRIWQVAQAGPGVDQQYPDLTPGRLLRLDGGAARHRQRTHGSMLAGFGSVLASPDSTDRAAR